MHISVNTFEGSSPHTRGAPDRGGQVFRVVGIIPAYAGSTPKLPAPEALVADHPRIRGEHGSRSAPPPGRRGSSPHTRGAHQRAPVCARHQGIIPAYAGSTSPSVSSSSIKADHPRIRGEHLGGCLSGSQIRGSSPHTRGARPVGRHVAAADGIIPAYAGSTMASYRLDLMTQDHPRRRGEHPRAPVTTVHGAGSSPHTRGAPAAASPRAMAISGSSPHTRGALCLHRRHRTRRRIIPAYAGSTRESTSS